MVYLECSNGFSRFIKSYLSYYFTAYTDYLTRSQLTFYSIYGLNNSNLALSSGYDSHWYLSIDAFYSTISTVALRVSITTFANIITTKSIHLFYLQWYYLVRVTQFRICYLELILFRVVNFQYFKCPKCIVERHFFSAVSLFKDFHSDFKEVNSKYLRVLIFPFVFDFSNFLWDLIYS